MALPPEAHVGGVVLPAALVGGAHGEELPAIAGLEELEPQRSRRERLAPEGKLLLLLNEAGVDPASVEGLAPVPVLPGVRLVPVV